MARQPSVWTRGNTGWFYTTIKGEQIRLSQDKAEAERMLHRILADQEPDAKAEEVSVSPTMKKICELFLEDALLEKGEETYKVQKRVLQSFLDSLKKGMKVADLKQMHVTEWFRKHPTWGGSYRTNGRKVLKACLNWAGKQGYIPRDHTITLMPTGRYERRERILNDAEKKMIRAEVRGDFADFLFALEQTGARPFSEIGKVTAETVDLEDGSITLTEWKNKKKTGKKRTIYMTPALKSLVERLVARHPSGPIFRNRFGNAWRRDSVAVNLTRLAGKLKIPQINAYCLRHTYITDCLAKGMSASIVAELVGNSVKTIEKYYDHLDQKKDVLKDAAKKAME